ncbi:MAG: ATP-binding protein [Pseudomonadota bacterium]
MKRHSQILRASVAIGLCVALVGAMLWHRGALRDAEEKLALALISSSWKASELIYEGERAAKLAIAYQAGVVGLNELQTQFDVFWSRVDIVSQLDMTGRPMLAGHIAALDDFLEALDPLLYGDTPPDSATLAMLTDGMGQRVVEIRRAWILEYNQSRLDVISPAVAANTRKLVAYEYISGGVLVLIVCYLLLELYMAALAQRREQALTEAAEAASKAKSEFIANVSHEVRTPLNGVLGMANILSGTNLDDEQTECLRVLTESGGLLLSTINDVLDYSKIEAGEVTIEYRDFEVEPLLETARALYSDAAQAKAVDLKISLPDGALPPVSGDGRRLRQVVHNLVSNAIKFTDEGSVTIEAQYRSPSKEASRSGLLISVIDTGLGISADAQARIFQPFGQADGSNTREHGGTGLGLTISRSICEAMQGTLTVQSEPGKGSRFEICLPLERGTLRPTEPKPGTPKDEAKADFSQLEILVVDDNKTNRLILRKFLKPFNPKLAEADSGLAAVNAVKEKTFDVILMDVQMPEMDGVEATRAIHAFYDDKSEDCPIIIGVTANALPHQVESYREAGMVDVLRKPVSKGGLVSTLTVLAPDKPSPGRTEAA